MEPRVGVRCSGDGRDKQKLEEALSGGQDRTDYRGASADIMSGQKIKGDITSGNKTTPPSPKKKTPQLNPCVCARERERKIRDWRKNSTSSHISSLKIPGS